MDPISICLLAAGLVKQIQAGCELYKQAKESFVEIKATADEVIAIGKEVHGFWGQLLAFFGSKPKPQAAKPVAKTKKSAYVAVDETQVKVDIVKNLTEFFRLQEQLAAHIREEEEKSQTVYDPDQNLMESALKRVMAAQQMAELEVQIRETMVYQSPPEMGALYSEVFKMREVIQEEQEQARLKQEATRRQEAWRQHQRKGKLQVRLAVLLAALFLVGYLHLWLQILRIKSTTTPPF
ncbi:hypothetical protein UFOVP628_11 [uncultured Caudovirales phage]|uniref:Uncharacterized protein n=1 Tax=uncultured Caudovirales phage TaxID=2100421 RepID=A0A6J5N1Z4_9CAUD|nr:hypothetical protein UFOVP628_11 [uncultured Caudovirales phage]